MTSFTQTFSGNAVSPADLSYNSYTFSANLTLFWPQFSAGNTSVVAKFMNLISTTSGLNVYFPDATLQSTGAATIVFNAGAQTVNIVSFTGAAIATISPNQTYYILLIDNTTQTGAWQTVQFGVGTGAASAAALAGAGLLASAGMLQQNILTNSVSTTTAITMSARAVLQVWTGGAGTINLPAAGSVGNGFFFPFANDGTSNVTIVPNGTDTIDGALSAVFAQSQSAFIVSTGTAWFTVGKGIQNNFSVTVLNLNVSGSSNVTETSSQAQNIIQQFTGVLTGNINVIVPATPQIYYLYNNTSGSYTLTFKTATGTGITVAQGSNTLVYCDGTNVVGAFSSAFGSNITLPAGSASSPPINFTGSTNTGIFSPASNQLAITAGGYEVVNFTSAASSVNYLQASASATTTPVSLSSLGTDSNISINYTAKGTGSHNFQANGGATQFYIGNVTGAVNQLNVAGAATTTAPTLNASGSDTNIDISLIPKGTGVVKTSTSFNGPLTGNVTGNVMGNVTGNITGTAPAGTLTGTTLAPNVTASSLTTFGSNIVLGTPASGTLTNCTIPASQITGTTLASNVLYSSLTGFGTTSPSATWDFYNVNAGGITDLQVKNNSTAASTQARLNLITGTANSNALIYLSDALQFGVITGSAITNGIFLDCSNAATSTINLKSGSGGLNINANGGNVECSTSLNGIFEIGARNSQATSAAQSRFYAATGSANSSITMYLIDNAGSPVSGIAVGSAVSVFSLPSNTVVTTQSLNNNSTKPASTAYVDQSRPLGAWGTRSITTIYQAATDGFLVINGGASTGFNAYTDSNNPPTTLRQQGGFASSGDFSGCTPVRKGDYYQVTGSASLIYFIGLGA